MKRLKGFTLVELVITIAIVIILSVVSVPIYRGYTRNAKMAEGYTLLGVILSAQKAYYSQYGNFLDRQSGSAKNALRTANEEVLGIDARGNKYFTSFNISGARDVSYEFRGMVNLPEDLKNSSNDTYLQLYYNITEGSSKFNIVGG